MNEYIITIYNGSYPFKHRCHTAPEAYGCVCELSKGLLKDQKIDLREALDAIANMMHGKRRVASMDGYDIRIWRDVME